ESDVYEFRLKKGQQLPIVIEARGLESPLDPVLRLTDAAGKLVNQAQGPARRLGTDPELAVTATADATYRLEVSDLHGDGGPRFVYMLRLAPARPDFALSVAADRFAVAPGKPLDLPVTVDRRNGFRGEVEVSAIGLPKGITADPVRVAAGARSATLRLMGEGTLAAGAFRIEGKTRSPELVRVARGPASEVSTVIENLWLTVSKTATVAPPPRKKKRR
ncbi:MAG: PPC domain-containing protein, partial [Gemmataceae bacterium]|nr:PPC domain-containing protein [Gemmataceae bacterium]